MLAAVTAVVVLACLIIVNGVLSMAELAVVASRRSRLQERAAAGRAGAAAALALAAEPNRFLSAVQVGITLVGVLAGAFGGATLAEPLAGWLEGALGPGSSDAAAVAVVAVAITYVTLVAGELAPKRVALHHPEAIAAAVARPMTAVARAMAPVVWVLSASTDFVLRLLRVRPSEEPAVSEDEIRLLVSQAREAGIVTLAEQEIVTSVLELGDRHVGEIMTPRPRVEWIDLDDPLAEALKKAAASGHSRFPLCRESLDEVVGVVSVRDLWATSLAREPAGLEALAQPALFLPESMTVLSALGAFKTTPTNVALVVDEYGGIEGLVTLADVLEALVGEAGPEASLDAPRIQQRDEATWLVDGLVSFEDFEETFGIAAPPERERTYQTVAGWVLDEIGRVPAAAEWFERGGYRVEIVDMDGPRVDKLLVSRLEASEGLPAAEPGT